MKLIKKLALYLSVLAVVLLASVLMNDKYIQAASPTPDPAFDPNAMEVIDSVLIISYELNSKNIDTTSDSNASITGTYKLKNPHDYQLNNLYAQIELVKENTESGQQPHGYIIFKKNINGYINLKPNQEISQNINLKVDDGLISGNYYVNLFVYDQTGVMVASQYKVTSITGKSTLLSVDMAGAFIVKGSDKLKAMSAVVIKLTDNANFLFTVQNQSNQTLFYKPRLEIYSRQEFPDVKPYQILNFDGDSLDATKSKDISLSVPDIKVPESYLVKAFLVDNAGDTISSVVYYRYIVAGEGGKILSSRATSFRNWTKEVITLRNTIVGPADDSEIRNAVVKVTVLSGNKVLKSTEQSVLKLGSYQSDVLDEISVSQSPFIPSKNLSLKIELISSKDNVLHVVNIPVPKPALPLMQISVLLLGLILIIVILYIIKKAPRIGQRSVRSVE